MNQKQDGRYTFRPTTNILINFSKRLKKTTVLILVFKEFLQTSIPPLISALYAKGHHDYPLKNFCLTVPKNFVKEPLCFRKFLVSKNVRDNRGGKNHDFPSKLFGLTVPNHFVEEPFCVSESFGYRKILCLRGEYHHFQRKICCLTVPKNFVGQPFCVSQNFWYRKKITLCYAHEIKFLIPCILIF